jgi:hypothetical protein
MARSEQQRKVLKLGKKLVSELSTEGRTDTLTKWMAHYLAELFDKIDKAKGAEKKALESETVDVILRIWKHRWTLPNGRRPLENFLPLLNLLNKLDAGDKDSYFYPQIPFKEKNTKSKQTKAEKGLTFWLQIAESIDKTARVWLTEAFHQAATCIADPEAKSWLENAVSIPYDYDRQIIVRLINDRTPDMDDEDSVNEFNGKLSGKTALARLKQLEGFKMLNDTLSAIYRDQLNSALDET